MIYNLEEIAPKIGTDVWVAPNAIVVGDIELGSDVGVWFGAVLRGDNEPIKIGASTNLQEHAMLHTDIGYPLTVGDGCTIGHRALLHGCTVGKNTLIGMGAMVMNGARIGDDCIIGAGALITEGKEIPARSLVVGAPGKVIRQLTDEDVEKLRISARHYVSAKNRFVSSMQKSPMPDAGS